MEGHADTLSLQSLSEGVCEGVIHVKLEKIISKEVVRYPLGPSRPMKELVAYQLLVFDEWVCV